MQLVHAGHSHRHYLSNGLLGCSEICCMKGRRKCVADDWRVWRHLQHRISPGGVSTFCRLRWNGVFAQLTMWTFDLWWRQTSIYPSIIFIKIFLFLSIFSLPQLSPSSCSSISLSISCSHFSHFFFFFPHLSLSLSLSLSLFPFSFLLFFYSSFSLFFSFYRMILLKFPINMFY